MTERPIIFNDAMSLAIIEGRKTVTRRPFPLKRQAHSGGVAYDQWSGIAELVADGPSKSFKMPCVVGDKLWVREAWRVEWGDTLLHYRSNGASEWLSCDQTEEPDVRRWSEKLAGGLWAPSIHMPRWASRTTLNVLGVRVERLQSMSEENAHAEGFESLAGFIATWNAIYPAMPWSSNPWVWAVEFKR